jgi:hypothetical protein
VLASAARVTLLVAPACEHLQRRSFEDAHQIVDVALALAEHTRDLHAGVTAIAEQLAPKGEFEGSRWFDRESLHDDPPAETDARNMQLLPAL